MTIKEEAEKRAGVQFEGLNKIGEPVYVADHPAKLENCRMRIADYEACAHGPSVQALVGALRFYADGKCDLEPKPEKAHLYVKDFEMNSPEWLQRSMSDFVSGRKARDAIEAWERATK